MPKGSPANDVDEHAAPAPCTDPVEDPAVSSGSRVWGCRVQGSGFGVWGLVFRVWVWVWG